MPNRRRPYLFDAGQRVQELLDQGRTHIAISIETGVSTRTIGRWLQEGRLRRPSPVSAGVPPTDAAGHAPEQEWTARALRDLGMGPAVVERVLRLVEDTAAVSNRRSREWLSRYIPLAAKIPDEWAAAVALLPILGKDLCNPALEELAELMRESVPWESGELRRRYGRLARALLSDARSTMNDWILFVSSTEMEEATIPVVEAGVVSEVLKRCPHVDRPMRKRRPVHKEDRALGLQLLRTMPMGALAMAWSRLVNGEPPWLEAYTNRPQRKARRQEKGKNIQ